MGTISAWVRRASATTLTAVGLTAAAAFVAANWLWSVDSSPPKPPPPTTLQELTLRELAGQGPEGVTAHFRYVNSLVPTTNLVPDATAGGSPLPLVSGARRPALVRRRAAADGVPDRPGRHPAPPHRQPRARLRRGRRHRLQRHPADRRRAPSSPGRASRVPSTLLDSFAGDAAISQPVPGVTGGRPRLHRPDRADPRRRPPALGERVGRRRDRHAAPTSTSTASARRRRCSSSR